MKAEQRVFPQAKAEDQGRFLALLVFLCAVLATTVQLRADVVVLQNSKRFDEAVVVGFQGGNFTILPTATDAVGFPVSPAQIGSIDFRAPGDSPATLGGRTATLVFKDGRTFDGVTVEAFTSGEGGAFRVRQAGVPAGGQSFPVATALVGTLRFVAAAAPGAPGQAQAGSVQGGAATLAPVAKPFDPAAAQAAPAGAPFDPAAGVPFDPASAAAQQAPPPAQSSGDQGPDFQSSSRQDSDAESKWGRSRRSWGDDEDSGGGWGSGGGGYSRLVGFGAWLTALSIWFGMATVVNFVYLKFAAWFLHIPDVSWKKAFFTGMALGCVPMIAFSIIWKFVPLFGMWFGLMASGYLSRAIIEGGLEILEFQAWVVGVIGYAISFGVLLFSISLAAS